VNATGPRGELLVAEQLMAHDWLVCAPLVAVAHFDLLATKPGVCHRVQVKATMKQHTYSSCRPHYQFQLTRGAAARKKYSPDDVDFFICCAIADHRFWVFPISAANLLTLKIYNGDEGRFHQYEGAWELLNQ